MARWVGDLIAAMEALSPEQDPYRDPGYGPFRRASFDPKRITVHHFDHNGLSPVGREIKRTVSALTAIGCRVEAWRPSGLRRSAEIWAAKLAETGDPSVLALLGDGAPIDLLGEWLRMPFGRSKHGFIPMLMASLERLSNLSAARTRMLSENGRPHARPFRHRRDSGHHRWRGSARDRARLRDPLPAAGCVRPLFL
jgi:hypothetical protein